MSAREGLKRDRTPAVELSDTIAGTVTRVLPIQAQLLG